MQASAALAVSKQCLALSSDSLGTLAMTEVGTELASGSSVDSDFSLSPSAPLSVAPVSSATLALMASMDSSTGAVTSSVSS